MSTKTSSNLRNFARKVRVFKNDIQMSVKPISEEIATELESDINENFNLYKSLVSGTQIPAEDMDSHKIETEIHETSNGCTVRITGEHLLYDEYGTGDFGKTRPHPAHDKHGMNPYNSGSHIIHSANHGNYWFYNHSIYHGNTAGCFVFNSYMNMKDGKAKEISRRYINRLVKGFKKSGKGMVTIKRNGE